MKTDATTSDVHWSTLLGDGLRACAPQGMNGTARNPSPRIRIALTVAQMSLTPQLLKVFGEAVHIYTSVHGSPRRMGLRCVCPVSHLI